MRPKVAAPVGASLVALSSVFYASYGIWTTLMGNFFGGYTASALRSILVFCMLAPAMLLFRQFEPLRWRQNWKYLTGMVLAASVVWGPLYYAILHAGVGMSLAVNYACLVIGMFLFGWLLAGEHFTRSKQISALLGLAGIGLIFFPGVTHFGWLALGAAAISGIGISAHMVLAKRVPYNASQSTLLIWVTNVIANIPMAFLFGESLPVAGWHAEWLYLLAFAAASVIASWAFVRGVKLIDAGAAGILGLLEIVFGVLFGVVFFHERPDALALFGVAVIIAAASIPYVKEYRLRRRLTR